MYPLYKDLRERLGEPLWHDQHGVPRYAEFHPSLLGVYDDWAALFQVRCEACGRLFPCAVGGSWIRSYAQWLGSNKDKELTQREREEKYRVFNTVETMLPILVGWKDAPWHVNPSQCAGTTMSTDVVAILQVWHQVDFEWNRVEVPLELANVVCEVDL